MRTLGKIAAATAATAAAIVVTAPAAGAVPVSGLTSPVTSSGPFSLVQPVTNLLGLGGLGSLGG
ncbi:hypothetical protein ABZ816_12045 [Actinosynnema sp. NPDC047251]|nr:hypothetical protein [Saccharothrix espanaensis]